MPSPYIKSALVISLKTDTKNSWLPRVKSARSQSVLGLNPEPQTLSPGWIHPQRLWKRQHPIQIKSKTQIVIHVTMLNSSIAALEENKYPSSYIHRISINTSKCFINGQTEVGCIFWHMFCQRLTLPAGQLSVGQVLLTIAVPDSLSSVYPFVILFAFSSDQQSVRQEWLETYIRSEWKHNFLFSTINL